MIRNESHSKCNNRTVAMTCVIWRGTLSPFPTETLPLELINGTRPGEHDSKEEDEKENQNHALSHTKHIAGHYWYE